MRKGLNLNKNDQKHIKIHTKHLTSCSLTLESPPVLNWRNPNQLYNGKAIEFKKGIRESVLYVLKF